MATLYRMRRLVLATLLIAATAIPVLASGPSRDTRPTPRLDMPVAAFAVGPVIAASPGISSSGCAECEGGVVELTVRYNGATAASIVVKDDVRTYFSGVVQPFELITLKGTKSDGKFEKNDLEFLVGGSLDTEIHVSCSKPINPGLEFGSFTVVDAISRTGGRVCPTTNSGCAECEGGVTELTLRYDGLMAATIIVRDDNKTYFSGVVQPGEEFTFSGTRSDGKFEKNDLRVLVNGSQNTEIHVSCSQPINPGLTFGSFTVVEAISRDGGRVCPTTTSDCAPCKGGVTSLTLRYDGAAEATIVVKDSKKTYFNGRVAAGAEFTFQGTRSDGKFEENNLTVLVNGSENTEIHVSCSQPINPGLVFGSFTVAAAVSKDGGNVCPLETSGCFECKDGIRSMTFRYDGNSATRIVFSVGSTTYFDRTVQPGEIFTVDNGGAKFAKNDVTVKIGSTTTTVHVSCSDPAVKPGYVLGGVLVMLEGTSGQGPMCGSPTCDIDLELQKEFLPEESNLGLGLVVYRLTLTNTEEAKTLATLITVKDFVPGAGTIESAVAAWGTTFDKATATWSVPILGVGETVSVLIGVRYQGTLPSQPNCAEVKTAIGDDIDSRPGNWSGSPYEDDEACAPVVEPPKVALRLKKSASVAEIGLGDVFQYTLTARNSSTATIDATNVVVTDLLPAGVEIEGSLPSGAGYNAATRVITWAVGTLKPAAAGSPLEKTLTFSVKGTVAGSQLNCAQVMSMDQEDEESTPGNGYELHEKDDDCVPVDVRGKIDLELEKEYDASKSDLPNKLVVYQLTLTNNSAATAAAKDVSVVDYLPAGGVIELATASSGTSFDAGTATWTVPSLAIGAQVSATLKVRFAAGLPTVANCAEVKAATGTDVDSTPGNYSHEPQEDDEACSSVPPPQKVAMRLAKTASVTAVNLNGVFEYTITVRNSSGASTSATNVVVADLLPTGVALEGALPGNATFDAATRLITWPVGTLAPNEARNLTFSVKAIVAGTQVNCAQVMSLDQQDSESTPGNGFDKDEKDDDCVPVDVRGKIDLELEKEYDASKSDLPNKLVVYQLTLTNNSAATAAAKDVSVVDYLPAGGVIELATASSGTSFDAGTATWTVPSLAIGAQVSATLKVRFAAGLPTIANCAEVKAATGTDVDSTPGNYSHAPKEDDEACASVPQQKVALRLKKSASVAEVDLGGVFQYTLTVRNSSTATVDATNVVVADLLPSGVEIEGALPAGATYNAATRTITWAVGTLKPAAAGSSLEKSLTFSVKATASGSPVNCAQVMSMDQQDEESTPGNGYQLHEKDDDCATVKVRQSPKIDVSLVKNVSNPYPSKGDEVTFTLVLRNEGPAAATNVRVKDYMPNGVTYVDGSASAAPGITFDKTTMSWLIGKLEAGALTALSFRAKVTVIGERINCAEVRNHDQEDIDSVPGTVSGTTLDCQAAPHQNLEDDETFVKLWITEDPQVNDAICYVVADNDSSGGETEDFLSKLTPDGQIEIPIGNTGTVAIEGIAFNPWNGVLFAANGPCLGTLNLNTAAYTQIGCAGSGMGYDQFGNYVEQEFDDMDGLTFDPHTGELYANLRKTEFGIDDIIIKLNPLTGKAVKNAFGTGIDYISIKGVGDLTDLDDIAIDPVDGTMYGINNDESENARLVRIDKMTGQMSDVRKLPVDNVEGLGFFGDGTLYGTGAEGFENILIINKQTLEITVVSSLGALGNFDYESLDCLVTNPSNSRVTLFDDQDGNGVLAGGETVLQGVDVEVYRDSDGDGRVSADDHLLTTRRSGAQGVFEFSTPANGAFVFKVSGSLSGESELGVRFEGFGERHQGSLAVSNWTSTRDEDLQATPATYRLLGNYPNPFNPTTSISFEAPTAGRVRLAVFDLLGRELSVLVDGEVPAGRHTVTFDAAELTSGTYVYRLESDTGSWTRSLTLLK